MKKTIYLVFLPLAVVTGLAFTFGPFSFGSGAHREIKNEIQPTPKPLSVADKKAHMLQERKKWLASPDGIQFSKWEASPAGKKIHASHDKIRKYLNDFSPMEAVVTSVTFQRPNAKSGPKWLIVTINDEKYMMQFIPKDFEKLKNLKVNDTIMVSSRSAGSSPNHPYLVLSGDYIARKSSILFKRDFSQNKGC